MNVWTGAPLLALWAGALVAGEQSLSMRGVCVAVLVLAAVAYAIAVVITKLSQLYDELAERPRTSDIRQSWLRSMRAEEKSEIAAREGVTAPDVIVVLNVCIAIASLIAWYALLASTPFSLVV
jgi:DNA-binding transcriptional regulator YbjK